MGGEGSKVRNCGGIGGAEEAFAIGGGEDVFAPEEGKVIVLEGQGLWQREVCVGVIKDHGDEVDVDNVVAWGDDG